MTLHRMARLALIACSLARCASAPPADAEIEAPVPAQYASVPRFEKGSDIEAPKAIKRVEPIAPGHLIGNGPRRIRATVEAVVNTQGKVEAVWYSSGDREWAQAAAQAISQWQFEPARRNGEPIAVRFLITTSLTTTGGWRNRP